MEMLNKDRLDWEANSDSTVKDVQPFAVVRLSEPESEYGKTGASLVMLFRDLDATGQKPQSDAVVAAHSPQSVEDRDSDDRLVLLSAKYAKKTAFNREDRARLEILNHIVDERFPRYTESDYRVLQEAEEFLRKL